MAITLLVILVLLLSVVVVQDFKNREISWVLIPLLFIGFVSYALLTIDTMELLTYFGINLLIVVSNLMGVTILVSLKEKKRTNIFDTYLGWGDVLFFIVLTVVFSPINFVMFYMGSILITTLVYGGLIFFNKKSKSLIPLAGTMSLMLIGVIAFDYLNSSINMFNDLIYLYPLI